MVIGIAVIALCAWCGWVSGYHRTTGAAEITWLVTAVAGILVAAALWRGGVGAGAGVSNQSVTLGPAKASEALARRSAASRRGWRSSWWCWPGRCSASIRDRPNT